MGRGSRDISQKLNNILFFLGGMLVVIIIAIMVIAVQTKAQNSNNTPVETKKDPVTVVTNQNTEEKVEKWQEGDITYNGKTYRYNADLKNYLVMGVDNDNPVEEAKDGVSGGQSDALFLIVTDEENEEISIFSINRNTMTDVAMYDKEGTSVGVQKAQICTQHAFGDGKMLSCSRTQDAVANLFGNIPINGYVSINMGAVPYMNNAVGGVEVEVLQDLKYPDKNVNLKKGDVVRLDGGEAYAYLRGRDINDFDSATLRLRREEQYFINYMNTLKEESGGSSSKALDIYYAISDYLVTDVDFAALAESLIKYDFSEDQLYTVPGEIKQGKKYEEFYVDEDELNDMIIEIFYREVN